MYDLKESIKPISTFYFDLAGVQNELEKTLRKKVDIGFIDSFKSYILKNIEPDLKCIYERQA
jgi:predicted nucleotidyltransferase